MNSGPQISQKQFDDNFCAETKKKILTEISITIMLECFVRSHRLFVCQSLHTLKTTYFCGCWVFIPTLVWGGRDVDWYLDLCYWGRGGGTFVLPIFVFLWLGGGGGFLWNS